MHEWAIAEAIIETIITKASESNTKNFSYIKVKLGKLQQIDREILAFAINELLKLAKDEHGIEVKEVVFDDEKAVAKCLRCGYGWDLDLGSMDESSKEYIHFIPEVVYAFISCPRCGSHDYDIVSGRGISVELG
ncbi:MAG: hydrogenase nickel incorporation protein HypA [Ignisphaera sp.]|uniref:Hydrogenase nickel incorporation protein HypA n=1 Tax=Ignisphaera aggregans TaxID=334771 RepID=A0A7C4JKP8_9CREN